MKDFKIELPKETKQDLIIDLLIQNLAYNKTLLNLLIDDYANKYLKDNYEAVKEFQDVIRQNKYEIFAFIASKYGK